jgi:ferredoxin
MEARLIRDRRKRKPKRLAVVNEHCTGCAGSPICVEACPVADCMVPVPDSGAPPFERIVVDPLKCIGCTKCMGKGPDGILLEGCPWDAILMVSLEDYEARHGSMAY